jgi:CubicO group peptidase (beta-lactamase class C family)
MSSSTTIRSNISSRLVQGRDRKGNMVPNWDFQVFAGAGAVLSNTADLVSFIRANFSDNPDLAFQREQTFSTGKGTGIALGWHILEPETGLVWHWHNGGTGGYRSQLVMDAQSRKAVVILSNVSASNPSAGNIDQLGFMLQETLGWYDDLAF